MANIYAPNNLDASFFSEILMKITILNQTTAQVPLIVGGDFHLVFDEKTDRKSYKNENRIRYQKNSPEIF
ncbi:hypothetical protein FKM82_005591 [Ascaphus truei]